MQLQDQCSTGDSFLMTAPDHLPQSFLTFSKGPTVGSRHYTDGLIRAGSRASWSRGAIIWIATSTHAHCRLGAQKRTIFVSFFFNVRGA
jgi:hypothetical protein